MSAHAITVDDWRDWVDARSKSRHVSLSDSSGLPPGVAEVYTPEGAELLIDGRSWAGYDEAGAAMYLLAHPIFEQTPYEQGLIERRLSTATGVANHLKFYLPSAVRAGGHAKRMMRRAVSLYDSLGINRVELRAQSVGKYVWANCGFEFATAGDRITVNDAARRFAEELGIADEWVEIEHPWEFAALDTRDGQDLLVPRGLILDFYDRLGQPVVDRLADVSGISPSKALLIHSRYHEWRGVLDLKQDAGRRVLMLYTEGHP